MGPRDGVLAAEDEEGNAGDPQSGAPPGDRAPPRGDRTRPPAWCGPRRRPGRRSPPAPTGFRVGDVLALGEIGAEEILLQRIALAVGLAQLHQAVGVEGVGHHGLAEVVAEARRLRPCRSPGHWQRGPPRGTALAIGQVLGTRCGPSRPRPSYRVQLEAFQTTSTRSLRETLQGRLEAAFADVAERAHNVRPDFHRRPTVVVHRSVASIRAGRNKQLFQQQSSNKAERASSPGDSRQVFPPGPLKAFLQLRLRAIGVEGPRARPAIHGVLLHGPGRHAQQIFLLHEQRFPGHIGGGIGHRVQFDRATRSSGPPVPTKACRSST